MDVIISAGYRVNSERATQFRQWATQVLKEFAIKGFVLDKKRLENGSFLDAIHGYIVSELVLERADSSKPHTRLTNWEGSPNGKILKIDVAVAKNYLDADELDSLGRIVNAYLELAEDRARRKIPMTMADWATRLDKFLEFDERDVL